MTALGDILAARADSARARGTVEAGALGLVTVEALPIREIERLSRSADANRAVFYAACREMQSAGAALLREGKLYRPDQVMALVSDAEAAAAAEAVRALSGWPKAGVGGRASTESTADNHANSGEAAEASVPGAADSAGTEEENAAANAAAETGAGGQAFHESEVQPATVRKAPLPVGEVRQGLVQEERGSKPLSHGLLAQGRETERPTAKVPSEKITDVPQNARASGKADGGQQTAGQAFSPGRAASEDEEAGAVDEYALEEVRTPHEAEQESAEQSREAPHESKSEQAEGMHRIPTNLAESVARELLDGLRRASWVR